MCKVSGDGVEEADVVCRKGVIAVYVGHVDAFEALGQVRAQTESVDELQELGR